MNMNKTNVIVRMDYKLSINNIDRNKNNSIKESNYVNRMIDYFIDDKKRIINMLDYFTGKINKDKEVNLVLENGVYRVATPEEVAAGKSTIIEAGEVTIIGLDSGTYYLEEIVAPNGYNKLADKIQVKISASYVDEESTVTVSGTNDKYDLVQYTNNLVTITNITGAELPSTGGMGTVLFLTIGSLMVLGFGVLLVTKLRMAKMAL